MALRVLQYAATIPANTPEDAPHIVTFDLDNWELEALELQVPTGPGGLMGFAVFNNGVQWIPQPAGSWLVWDNVLQSWPFADQPNASGWSVVGWNVGVYEHTVTVRFHVNLPTQPEVQVAKPTVTFITSEPPELPVVTL